MNEMINLVIIAITVITSIMAWYNERMMADMLFYPPAIRRGQWYRFFSHGLIHANIPHLFFNAYALYGFGSIVEKCFEYDCMFRNAGGLVYLLFYVTALIASSLPDYFRHRNSAHYRALGASGAVSAVVFSSIIFAPQFEISLFLFPIGIPGWVFGLLYLVISSYLDRRGDSNIGHNAHFWGGVYGIIFTVVVTTLATKVNIVDHFRYNLKTGSEKILFKCDDE